MPFDCNVYTARCRLPLMLRIEIGNDDSWEKCSSVLSSRSITMIRPLAAGLFAGALFVVWYLSYIVSKQRRRAERPWENLRQGARRRLDIKKHLHVHKWIEKEEKETKARSESSTIKMNNTRTMESIRQISQLRPRPDDMLSPSPSFAICRVLFEKDLRVCTSNSRFCPHVYHEECVATWLVNHNRCPLCRLPYLSK